MTWRRNTALLLAVLVTAACGDALGGVGDLSHRIVYGSATTTTSTLPPTGSVALRLKGISGLVWTNDGLGAETVDLSGGELTTAVWVRGDQINPFVQASRREIAAALPGIEFPQLAPERVTHISSQLLFDPLTGIPDAATTAAFGLWIGAPYELPRNEGQLAVLRVGMRSGGDSPEGEIASFQVTDGRELAWVDGPYVYQLFCRTGMSEAACFAMAESTVPLSLIVGLP